MFVTGVSLIDLIYSYGLIFKRPESKKEAYHQDMIYKFVTLSVWYLSFACLTNCALHPGFKSTLKYQYVHEYQNVHQKLI